MKQVQIFVDSDILRKNRPLFEYIIHKLIQEGIKTASVFRSVLSFDEHRTIKRPDELFSFDGGIMLITFIEPEDKVRAILNLLKEDLTQCVVVTHNVEYFKYD